MKTRVRAAIGSLVFLAVAPGVVAGVLPWWITRWRSHELWLPLRIAGALLIVGGAAALLQAFARFVVEGLGTPAPVAPTRRLVVGGLYHYVRNPMYIAVAAVILGQALLFGRVALVAYLAVFCAAVAAFVLGYEEPTLRRQFGAEYERYEEAVPRWWPRRRR